MGAELGVRFDTTLRKTPGRLTTNEWRASTTSAWSRLRRDSRGGAVEWG